MSAAVLEDLENKAYFVSGKSAWFRASSDPVAKSAVLDAKNLLLALEGRIKDPLISAGTTADPDRIITMTWMVSGYSTIRSIEISCKGHNKFDVSWDDPAGKPHRHEDITLTGVKLLDIPGKMESLEIEKITS